MAAVPKPAMPPRTPPNSFQPAAFAASTPLPAFVPAFDAEEPAPAPVPKVLPYSLPTPCNPLNAAHMFFCFNSSFEVLNADNNCAFDCAAPAIIWPANSLAPPQPTSAPPCAAAY